MGNDELTTEDYPNYFERAYNKDGKYYAKVTATCYIESEDGYYKELNANNFADLFGADNNLIKTSNAKQFYYEKGQIFFNAAILQMILWITFTVQFVTQSILTITAVSSLGAPINKDKYLDPDGNDPLLPDPDEVKDHFIKAEINVLQWHVLNNNVTL